MKTKLHLFFLSAVCLCLASCNSYTFTTSQLFHIERGMSQEEVLNLLGEPDYRRFDETSEQWEYCPEARTIKIGTYAKVVLVDFVNGKVTSMDSFNKNLYPEVVTQVPLYPENNANYSYSQPTYSSRVNPIVGSQQFQQFCEGIKKQSFENDMLNYLSSGVIGSRFTCEQCAKILSLFSFESGQLKALEIVAPHLSNHQGQHQILDAFTFSSGKEKALKILSR